MALRNSHWLCCFLYTNNTAAAAAVSANKPPLPTHTSVDEQHLVRTTYAITTTDVAAVRSGYNMDCFVLLVESPAWCPSQVVLSLQIAYHIPVQQYSSIRVSDALTYLLSTGQNGDQIYRVRSWRAIRARLLGARTQEAALILCVFKRKPRLHSY